MLVNVLIVDDYEINQNVISSILSPLQYNIKFANNGEKAIEIIKTIDIELVLLDINMPVMDGYETCRYLKNDPNLKYIPIIFITSYDDTDSIIKGFEAGGNDYISKPFNAQELIARVKTQIELRCLVKEKIINTKFESIGKLSAGTVHEINTPLTFIKGNFEMMKMDLDDLEDSPIKSDLITTYEQIQSGLGKISKIVDSMRELSQKSSEQFENSDIKHTVCTTLVILYNSFKKDVTVNIEDRAFDIQYTPDDPLISKIQKQRIEQVWMIIIKNAVDILKERTINNKTININFKSDERYNVVYIEDNGGGVDKQKIQTLFNEPLNSTKNYSGLGVGLYIAKKILLEHNGDIKVENTNNGALFKIYLPK